jgi:phage shock protein E
MREEFFGMENKHFAVLFVVLAGLALVATGCAAPAAVAEVQMVTPEAVHDRLPGALENGLILLDVRTQQEWEDDGHIAGATLIPLDMLEQRAPEELPKDAEIVVYCRSGNRSAQASQMLAEMGYTNVLDMGGIVDWKDAGYDVVYGP